MQCVEKTRGSVCRVQEPATGRMMTGSSPSPVRKTADSATETPNGIVAPTLCKRETLSICCQTSLDSTSPAHQSGQLMTRFVFLASSAQNTIASTVLVSTRPLVNEAELEKDRK